MTADQAIGSGAIQVGSVAFRATEERAAGLRLAPIANGTATQEDARARVERSQGALQQAIEGREQPDGHVALE